MNAGCSNDAAVWLAMKKQQRVHFFACEEQLLYCYHFVIVGGDLMEQAEHLERALTRRLVLATMATARERYGSFDRDVAFLWTVVDELTSVDFVLLTSCFVASFKSAL